MFRNQALLCHSKTSAFVDYGDLITDKNGNLQSTRTNPNPNMNTKRNSVRSEKYRNTATKSGGVSFNMISNVIGYDGGREYLFENEYDYDDDVFASEDDDVITNRLLERMDELLKLEMSGSNDLDQLTASNTRYNANLGNFNKEPKKSILVATAADYGNGEKSAPCSRPPTAPLPQPDVIPPSSLPSNNNGGPVFKCSLVPTYTVTDDVAKCRPNHGPDGSTNGKQMTSIKNVNVAFMTAANFLNNDKSPSPGRQLSEDSSACTSDSSRGSPPEEAPPPVPQVVKHQTSRPPAVPVRKPRPRDHNSADPRMYGAGPKRSGGKMDKDVEERLKHLAVDLETQRRSPKRPAPPPPPVGNNGAVGKPPISAGHRAVKPQLGPPPLPERTTHRFDTDETLGSRGRFASIRKLLKIDNQQKPSQQQTLPNAPDKKFRSLRRFPSPFTKNRIDLAEMRNFFHTERDTCAAAGEIATDSAVVVTDIVELRSAANTLTRHNSSNKEEFFSSTMCYVNTDSYSSGYCSSGGGSGSGLGQNFHSMQNVQVAPPSPVVVKSLLNKADSQPTLRCYGNDDDDEAGCRGNRVQDLYEKMISQDVATLADVAERFPDLGTVWKRSMAHLVNATDLKFNNFLVLSNVPMILTETMAIYPGAVKLEQEYLEMPMPKVNILMTPIKYANGVSAGKSKQRHVFNLPVITEFQDYVPANLLKINSNISSFKTTIGNGHSPLNVNGNDENVLCKITVLPNVEFLTFDKIRERLVLDDQKICFVMIQLIACLKHLQSHGVEEVRSDMDGFLLMHSAYMRMPKLCLCWESAVSMDTARCQATATTSSLLLGNQRNRQSLCHCALRALYTMMNIELSLAELLFRNKFPPKFFKKSPYSETFQLVVDELIGAKCQSLTQAKSFLDYTFWVANNSLSPNVATTPVSVKFNNERDAKIWLETERAKEIANLLKLILKYPDRVDSVEECRIQFLLNSTPKYLLDASKYANFERYDIIV